MLKSAKCTKIKIRCTQKLLVHFMAQKVHTTVALTQSPQNLKLNFKKTKFLIYYFYYFTHIHTSTHTFAHTLTQIFINTFTLTGTHTLSHKLSYHADIRISKYESKHMQIYASVWIFLFDYIEKCKIHFDFTFLN